MEIMKIIQTLQEPGFEVVAYKMGVPFAASVDEAVALLVSQGERIADLEAELSALEGVGLTPEELAFFRSPKMVEICKRLYDAVEKWKAEKAMEEEKKNVYP